MGKRQKKSNRNSSNAKRQKASVYQGFRVNRKYKDSLFRMIFKSREALLSLYNAINKSHYENPEDLEITTIEDVIYIGVKNDVSFLIDSFMNLYEAQSTKNPNMPLRGLIYFAQLYQSYAAQTEPVLRPPPDAANTQICSSLQRHSPGAGSQRIPAVGFV